MTLLGILFVTGLAAFLWGTLVERRAFQINRYEVKLKKHLPRPVRILHLSDIHFASHPSPYDAFFDKLANEKVDFVVVSGDIIDCQEGIPAVRENFKKLKPRMGFYAVYGNHDYYDYHWKDVFLYNLTMRGHPRPLPKNMQQIDLLTEALQQAGVRVLRNESHGVRENGVSYVFHGVDDPITGRAKVERIAANFNPHHVNFLLTHSVDLFYDIGEGEIDVSFSGHSHGGQVCLPWYGALIRHTTLGKEFISGLKRMKGAVCSISRGVGTSRHAPIRFLAPPEAILLNVHGS